MKLETAIERLETAKEGWPGGDDAEEYYMAMELGSEALKRLIAWRNDNDEDLLWDLPGETEE